MLAHSNRIIFGLIGVAAGVSLSVVYNRFFCCRQQHATDESRGAVSPKKEGTRVIVVASSNKTKIQAVRSAFEKLFPSLALEIHGVAAKSGVSDQPMTEAETKQGAFNRACHAKSLFAGEADFYVGLEGGVERKVQTLDGRHGEVLVQPGLECFAWMVVLDGKGTKVSTARTGSFFLPPVLQKMVEEGMELGHADDVLFKRTNSKEDTGTVGILTNGAINRAAYYEHAMCLALIPFLQEELYVPV
eukprot:GILJ01007661.1.p1 GENE.GILJ01007661.1~~GILJ01007661.1.p1  ORF type:complete len:245 (-),score=34.82 GILJ01007661.1:115-849(-)